MEDEKDEQQVLVQINGELQDIISDGLFHVESSLFNQSVFIHKRVNRLSGIIDGLEERLLNADDIQYMSPQEVLGLYKTYSKISQELMAYQIEIHKLVADMSKFESVKSMIGKTQEKIDRIDSTLRNPKVQKLLSLVDEQIQVKTDESRRTNIKE